MKLLALQTLTNVGVLGAGENSPVFNLPEPSAARSLTYYALLDGLNGSDQYYGAILLKVYEAPDAQGKHK